MSEWQETEYGKAPVEWRVLTLDDISDKITDGAHQSPRPQSIGKYMCSVKDMTYNKFDFSGSKLISDEDYEKLVKQGCQPKYGDILISKDGANCLDLIFVFRQTDKLVLLSSIAIVRLFSDYIPDFVRYFLLSPDCQYTMRNNYVSGSAIPRVVLKDFKKVPILLPPLPEQKAIAAVLSSLDDKIDLLHRQNLTLEAMAETLFRQWFIEEAGEDWEDGNLGDFVTISYGKNLPTKNLLSKGYSVFGANGQIGFYDKYSYEEPQVLVSCRGEASGKVNISLPKSFVTNNSLALERNKRSEISFELLKYWALTYDFKLHVSGSAQPQITIDGLYDADFTLPDKESIDRFTAIVRRIEEKRLANSVQIHTLEKLRDTLLPKLMSGEIRVKFA
ncbi:MAG: restriction endonuclease subunit S [Methylomicrobium sp.]|nr:restriction endonuclease subunit S [Methylomicrobium sp.]